MVEQPDKNNRCRIIKIDEKQRIVFGIVLIPNIPDLDGDIITEEEIERTAHRYLIESRITGFRHQSELNAAIVESYISKNANWFGDEQIPKGSWLVAMKIFDDIIWQGILDGKYNAFSVGGYVNQTKIVYGKTKNGD